MKSTKEIIEEMVAICEREGIEHCMGEEESELSCILNAVSAVMRRAPFYERIRLESQKEKAKKRPPLYEPACSELRAAIKRLVE